MALALEQVGVAFGGFRALTGVSLSVGAGDVVGLIGPNGAGKTTCINVLTGFQRPSSGRVLLEGRDVSALPAHRLRRAGVARTFQAGRLFGGLDVLDNLACTGIGLGLRRAEAERRASDLLGWMGIAPLQSRPAAGMSEAEANDLAALIRRIAHDRGIGCLLIEHNVGLVLSVCSDVVVLDGGRVIEHGDRSVILGSGAVREAYLGAHAEAA